MDIEKVAKENPEKIITKKIEFKEEGPTNKEILEIISIFKFDKDLQDKGASLIKNSLQKF